MKTLSDFIIENLYADGNMLRFDPMSSLGISSKIGKSKDRKPYTKKTEHGTINSVYSINKSKHSNYADILTALKNKESSLTITKQEYDKFINRTAVYAANFVRTEIKPDVILTMQSSSNLASDFSNAILKRLGSGYEFLNYDNRIAKAVDVSSIWIDFDKIPNLQDSTRKSAEKVLKDAVATGKFEIKKFAGRGLGPLRKFVKDWLIMKNMPQAKIFDKSVLLVDDILTTGSTIEYSSELLAGIGATSVHGITIFKLT